MEGWMYACMSERECVVSPHSRESVWQARQSVCVRERKRERMRERERERERERMFAQVVNGGWELVTVDPGEAQEEWTRMRGYKIARKETRCVCF